MNSALSLLPFSDGYVGTSRGLDTVLQSAGREAWSVDTSVHRECVENGLQTEDADLGPRSDNLPTCSVEVLCDDLENCVVKFVVRSP